MFTAVAKIFQHNGAEREEDRTMTITKIVACESQQQLCPLVREGVYTSANP
jgi:hypothetical protein